MQKITTHLWFDTQAREAAEFYTTVFPNSSIKSKTKLNDTPSGSVDIVSIEVCGHQFIMMSAGPLFKFTPAVSFAVSSNSKEEVKRLWRALIEGGMALMELGEYPFSEKYGWLQDKFGLSWQIMYAGDQDISHKITPTMMFVGDVCGKAEEAIDFYASVFHHSHVGYKLPYAAGEEPDVAGTLKYGAFTLEGSEFAAMDSARTHNFTFNEAISFMVHCDTQEEIDYYWDRLTAVPESEQCGWLKDRFGFSWQIVPTAMNKMMENSDPEKIARVTQAFLQMKKFDIAKLQEAAAEGK